jgi:PAS domain S-box-containing protein
MNNQVSLYESMLESAPIGTVAYDEKGQCYFANNVAAEIIGAQNKALILQQNYHHIPSWKTSGIYEIVLKALKTNETLRHTVFTKSTFGREIWLDFIAKSFETSDGKHLIIMINDISEIKKNEFDFAEKNKLLSSVQYLYQNRNQCHDYFELSKLCLDCAIQLTQSKFGFIGEMNNFNKFDTTGMANPAWQECHISETEQLPLIKNMKISGIWGHVLQTGKPLLLNKPHEHSASSGLPVGHPELTSFLGYPLIRNDLVFGMIALANNETGYNQRDLDNLEILSNAIIDVLSNKNSQLLTQKYIQEIEKSNKKLDEFAYISSHDLKEPLRAISNYSLFLQEDYTDLLDAEGKRFIKTIVNNTKRMDALLNTLLRYSRLGRTNLHVQKTNINSVLMDIIENYQDEKHIQIIIDSPLPEILCDKTFVDEIFTNLISNALKYNIKDKKVIHIGYIPETLAMPHIFYVKDNGIGIDPKDHENVFQIFKRLHSRDEFQGGTGAGLTITRKMVEAHKGKIWLESMPEKGATFYFYFGVLDETTIK